MTDIDQLEAAFPEIDPPSRPSVPSPGNVSGPDYDQKLKRLGDKWRSVLDTPGDAGYASASEADLALIDALVKRNWTDGDIWTALRGSARYRDRVDRKGERHTEQLYAKEIGKARSLVTPFPPDEPRTDRRRSAGRERRTRTAATAGTPNRRAPQPAPPGAPEPEHWSPSTSPESFITRYVAYASQRTDAPPEAHELMAVGILSSLVGPGTRLPIAATVGGWKLTLWTLYVVNSTVGRKSTVINLARDILDRILSGSALVEWEGSPQGLIQRLQDRDGKPAVFLRDEYSGLMQQMNRGGHMAGLAQTLIRAYDGGVIENIRVRKKNALSGKTEADNDRVADPYLTTLAASTLDSFVSRCTIDNVLDGFLARFIIVSGEATPRPMAKLTAALLDQRGMLLDHARAYAERAEQLPEIDLSPDVMAAAWDLEQAWIAEAQATDHPGAMAASFKRLSESVLKVAALIAIDEADVPRVEMAHYQAASSMSERWKASTQRLIEQLGATEFQHNCDRILETVRHHPGGIGQGDLYRRHRRLRKRDYEEAIGALIIQGLIEEAAGESSGGRPPTIIYPAGAVMASDSGEEVP